MLWLVWTFIAVVLGLPVVAIAIGRGAWPFELVYHFVGHLAVVALLTAVGCLFLRFHAPAVAAGVLALVYGVYVTMPSGTTGSGAAAAAPVSNRTTPAAVELVSFNLLFNQHDPGRMLEWLASGPADVLVLVEVGRRWHAGIDTLRPVYPHQILALPRSNERRDCRSRHAGRYGVAILSRVPLCDARAIYPNGVGRPSAVATLETSGGAFNLVAAHAAAPVSRMALIARNAYLSSLARELEGIEGPLVVAGDFNATRYTPPFRRFRNALGLAAPLRCPATYPAKAGPFGIGIDHVLVRGVRLDRLDPLPPHGSDHRGLLARLIIPGH